MAANYTGIKIAIGAASVAGFLVGWSYFDSRAVTEQSGQPAVTSVEQRVSSSPPAPSQPARLRTSRGS
jgi:hypothetical protein